jgi:hypothetical protein
MSSVRILRVVSAARGTFKMIVGRGSASINRLDAGEGCLLFVCFSDKLLLGSFASEKDVGKSKEGSLRGTLVLILAVQEELDSERVGLGEVVIGLYCVFSLFAEEVGGGGMPKALLAVGNDEAFDGWVLCDGVSLYCGPLAFLVLELPLLPIDPK